MEIAVDIEVVKFKTWAMSFILTNLLLLLLAALFFWWLSDFDSRLSGVNGTADFIRRGLRCAVSLVLVEISFIFFWRYLQLHDPWAGFLYLLTAMPLVIIWCGCLSHLGGHLFTWLIDPDDRRSYHPRAEVRLLDRIGDLIRTGKTAEAIRVCEALNSSGEVNVVTLELTLEHLGVPQKNSRIFKPLAEADRLRSQGKYSEAKLILQSLLIKNPRDPEAAMLLMRLYAQDLRQPDSARRVLQNLAKQPHVVPAHLDFARRSIEEWSNPELQSPEPIEPPPVGSVDELLAQGFFGTAIEILEGQVKAKPEDFDLLMKLVTVHAVVCKNLPIAEKLVKQMEGAFSREQIRFAGDRLQEWRKTIK
jgi:hypothetical protein